MQVMVRRISSWSGVVRAAIVPSWVRGGGVTVLVLSWPMLEHLRQDAERFECSEVELTLDGLANELVDAVDFGIGQQFGDAAHQLGVLLRLLLYRPLRVVVGQKVPAADDAVSDTPAL